MKLLITPPFCHSFLRPMTTSLITIPRRRPVLNLRFIGCVFAISRESFAHQRAIYRSIRIKSQSPLELSLTLLWTDLGYFLRNGKKKRKEKEKEKIAAQLELKIVNNIALWLLAGLQHTKLRSIVSYKTHNPRQVKNSKLKIYL